MTDLGYKLHKREAILFEKNSYENEFSRNFLAYMQFLLYLCRLNGKMHKYML